MVHKDLTDARIKRDTNDVGNIANYLISRDPFDETPELRSIASGITADDKAEEVGAIIIENMEGKSVQEHGFSTVWKHGWSAQYGNNRNVFI